MRVVEVETSRKRPIDNASSAVKGTKAGSIASEVLADGPALIKRSSTSQRRGPDEMEFTDQLKVFTWILQV